MTRAECSEPWKEGYLDRADDGAPKDNPYVPGTDDYREWERGFYRCEDDGLVTRFNVLDRLRN